MQRYFSSYSSALLRQNFDAIVIGSGVSGLATAIYLSKHGKKVLVLEQHNIPGGFTHTFHRKQFEWDIGVHYIGNLQEENSNLKKTFEYLTGNQLQWESMGEVYEKIIFGNEIFHYVAGLEKQKQNLINYFPKEKKAIEKYYDLLISFQGKVAMYFGEKAMPFWLSKSIGWLLRIPIRPYFKKSTYDTLSSFIKNEKLLYLLCAQCGNYGLPPKKSPFAIHAIVAGHYVEGGWYPVGGSAQINLKMAEHLQQHGGVIACSAMVKKILLKDKRAVGVELQNGDRLSSNIIVSTVGIFNTYCHLLAHEELFRQERLLFQNMEPSVAHICVSVGLNKGDKELNLPKHNIWCFPHGNIDTALEEYTDWQHQEPPLYYFSFPSAKDPHWQRQNPHLSTIQIIVPARYEWFKQWENTRWGKRGSEYERVKEIIARFVINKLHEVLPQTAGAIEMYDVSSPLSTRHFNNYAHGEIYGLEQSGKRFLESKIRIHTKAKGLYLSGQDITCVGVGGALASATITASTILRKNLFSIKS
jgi:all-trans-retinol 13,14-reductase